MHEIEKQIMQAIRVHATSEFDRNFERKGFFDKQWAKKRNSEESNLVKTSALRRSIQSHLSGSAIVYTSRLPYASIHNYGGGITITPKMRKFFWAMYYKNMTGVSFSIKTRKASGGGAAKNSKAEFYKGMALHRGDKITMPQRQFIGVHPSLDKDFETIIQKRVTEYLNKILETFNKKINTP